MEVDVVSTVGAVTRKVLNREHEGRAAKVVAVKRSFDATIEDVWDALTNPERIPRWFLPVSGDLELGGHYQLEGNAGGEITGCDPPNSFAATWEFEGQITWIEVRLREVGEQTRFELEHTSYVDEKWEEFGPGAVGVGWDMAIMGLQVYLTTGEGLDPAESAAWMASDNGKQFARASSYSWCAAAIASGDDAGTATAAAGRTVVAYAGEGPGRAKPAPVSEEVQ
jgi:uncharacterized protein YndB with AHSA1/START domain